MGEESWDLFTNPDAYLGEYEDEQQMKEYAMGSLKRIMTSAFFWMYQLVEEHQVDTLPHLILTTNSVREKSQMPQSIPHSVDSVLVVQLSISLPDNAKVLTACILATG